MTAPWLESDPTILSDHDKGVVIADAKSICSDMENCDAYPICGECQKWREHYADCLKQWAKDNFVEFDDLDRSPD